MTKTQTKNEIRNTASKIDKLLRGIDNNTEQAKKDQKKLEARVDQIAKDAIQVKTLISGISNTATALVSAAVPAAKAKPAAKVAAAKPAKPAATAKAKPAAKPAAKAKPVIKVSEVKKGQGSAKKPPGKAPKLAAKSGERRPLKEVINDIFDEKGSMKAADLYKEVTRREGYYSRQSLYMALKSDEYKKSDDERFERAVGAHKHGKSHGKSTSTDEADAFVSQVDGNAAVSSVV